MIEIDLKPESAKLRQFGFVAFAAFGLIAGLIAWRGGLFGISFGDGARTVAIVLASLGGLAGLLSLVAPAANRPLYVAIVLITWPIGFVLSFLVLGTLFYLILTPVGLFFRLIGRDPLHLSYDRNADTYWHERSTEKRDPERYFRQF